MYARAMVCSETLQVLITGGLFKALKMGYNYPASDFGCAAIKCIYFRGVGYEVMTH